MIIHIDTLCNQCGGRTENRTQTEAFAACQAHEILTDHDDQLVATPGNGWTRWR